VTRIGTCIGNMTLRGGGKMPPFLGMRDMIEVCPFLSLSHTKYYIKFELNFNVK